jgi:aldehyde dehydrogenase
MRLDEAQIGLLVEKVVERLAGGAPRGGHSHGSSPSDHGGHRASSRSGDMGAFETVDEAVGAATKGAAAMRDTPVRVREAMVEAMRRITLEQNADLARRAVEETGMGRIEDKINKNKLVASKTPGPEILRPQAVSGDDGLMLTERAPYGVIAAITPCTNVTETILCNAIGMISGGNAVVFNVHPTAANTSVFHVSLLNEAIAAAGGPEGVITVVRKPTIDSAQKLMTHKQVRLVVVTGGGAVVQAAMTSGKRAIAAGPGNPPVVVDETADLRRAGAGIVAGASLDNTVVCIAEKELIVVEDVAEALKKEIKQNNAIEVRGRDLQKLEKLLITPDNHVNRKYIGKNPSFILRDIGIQCDDSVRLVLCEVPDERHPFVQHEMLLPVLAMVRVPNVDEAVAMAKRVEHGYRHTAVMYSNNIQALHNMARAMDCSIFVKNAPSSAGLGLGGEGYTSFTIASPTGEGLTNAIHFTRERRCTLKDHFRIV